MAHGEYGAQGRPSWELAWEAIDSLIEFRKGWPAQLRYLDEKRGGAAYLAREGLTPTRDQRRRWAGKGAPTRANQAAIQRAYRELRRRNAAGPLLRKLAGGAQIELHPEGEQPVAPAHRRGLQVRTFRLRNWDRLVRTWAAGDSIGFEAAWKDILEADFGDSDWRAYLYASAVGIIV